MKREIIKTTAIALFLILVMFLLRLETFINIIMAIYALILIKQRSIIAIRTTLVLLIAFHVSLLIYSLSFLRL